MSSEWDWLDDLLADREKMVRDEIATHCEYREAMEDILRKIELFFDYPDGRPAVAIIAVIEHLASEALAEQFDNESC